MLENLQTDRGVLSDYRSSEIDETGDPNYFGFLRKDGVWYILELNNTNGTLRYFRGDSDFATAWTNRASHAYDTFDVIF